MKIFRILLCFYLPIIIFLINTFIIGPLGVYQRWAWFDIPMHIIGGMAIAYSFILLIKEMGNKLIINNKFLKLLIVIGLLSIVMIFWEFYQYIWHMIIEVDQNKLRDTLSDFMFGLIGGLLIAIKVRK